jgi:ADP-ribosylglycohydrolase
MAAEPFSRRVRGCILGGAIGDALSGAFGGTCARQPPLFTTGPKLSGATWLMVATCEAIAREGGRARPDRVAAVFQEWFGQNRFGDAAAEPFRALRELSAGADWTMSGARGDVADGSDVAVRAAPLAFVLDPRRDEDRQVLQQISRITRHDDDAHAGAIAMILAVRRCLGSNEVPPDLLAAVAADLPDGRLRDRLVEVHRFRGDPADAAARFGVSAEVPDAVPLALLVATRHPESDLEASLVEATGVGGGAGTIPALTGQLIGAAGCDLPPQLLAALPERAALEGVLEPFVQTISSLAV